MKKWIASATLLSLFLVGCEKKEKSYHPTSQELRLNLHTEPPTLDPRKATDSVSTSILNLCFEGLMRIEPNGEITAAAAEKIEVSPDKKKYVFTLREAKWSDGKPVTARDFEKTWKTMLSPTFPCEFASDLYIIKNARAAKLQRCSLDEVGIQALDDRTLQVELEHPTPYFLSALSTHSFFPTPEHITSAHSNWTKDHYVSNGPFFMKKWSPHDFIQIEKNPEYWDAKCVKLEKVLFTLVEDEMTELTMFENSELDWAGYPLSNLPTEALDVLSKKGELNNYPISGIYYYVFNTKEPPFTNANIRKALTFAINREAIITNVTQMGQSPAMGLIPKTMWKDGQPHFKDHDVIEARRLFALGLQELGITANQFPEITLSYNTLIGHHKIAQAIQQEWKDVLGIRVKLENKEWKVFLDELRHHKFQVARMGGIANLNDPITFLDYYRYLSSSNNHSQWTHPQFSELLEEADQTADEEKRFTLLRAAEKILMNEMPIAPIYFYSGTYLKKPYVKGIHLSELNNLDLKWAYLELDDQVSR